MGQQTVAVAGIGIEVPGVRAEDLLRPAQIVLSEVGGFDPSAKLGPRGYRYKDHATRLALCAARTALQDAALPAEPDGRDAPERFGVVVSSNLGNVDTVCRVAATIREGGVDATSPMDLPNASSNVAAATLAIWFGLKGPNLTLCNGSTSGIDALHAAATMIRAGRADRMLVVGVEPSNPVAARLMEESVGRTGLRLMDGAAAVVLESSDAVRRRGGRTYGVLSGYRFCSDADAWHAAERWPGEVTDPPDVWLVPNRADASASRGIDAMVGVWASPPHLLDLSGPLGESYGAQGVLQCVAASLWLFENSGGRALLTSGPSFGDGSASLRITRAEPSRAAGVPPVVLAERTRPEATLRAYGIRPGEGASPSSIAFVHGMEERWDIWAGVQQSLSPAYRVFSLELPWAGQADYRAVFDRAPREWLREALELLPGPPEVVVSHSFGANALLELLLEDRPGTLKGAVLVSPFYKRRAADFDWALLQHYVERFPDLLEEGLRVRLRADRMCEETLAAMTRKVRDRIGPFGWLEFFASFARTPSLDLARIRDLPLLISGGANDFASFPEHCHDLAEAHGNATVALLAGCGHFCMLEQPARIGDLIQQFVQRTITTR